MRNDTAANPKEAAADVKSGGLRSPVQAYLEQLHGRYLGLRDGAVASYIPELAKVDPDGFGICLATTDGQVYEVGDSRRLFTIQSISKPFTYGLALEDCGQQAVLQRIGVEPTGDAFNSISLEPGTGRPLNPMINAGAIAAAAMVAGHSQEDRVQRLLAVYSIYAGRPLSIDQAVFDSERETGHRNRAIGHMLRNFNILSDPEPALDLYFRQCSVALDCRDLSLMAATLANGGVNPLTGERAIKAEYLERMLSVMTTCGLYDAAGLWVFEVGMPAKSGVGGAILVVLPGQLGLAVYSPRLDERGNSVRGLAVCGDLSRDMNLHFLRMPPRAPTTIRAQYNVSGVSSNRYRTSVTRAQLATAGVAARVYELQGELDFGAMEVVVRAIIQRAAECRMSVLDFQRVNAIGPAARRLLRDLLASLSREGHWLILASADRHSVMLRELAQARSEGDGSALFVVMPTADAAIEWCENRLLGGATAGEQIPICPTLAEHALCNGLSAEQVEVLAALLTPMQFARGQTIIRYGDEADRVYLLMQGEVTVTLPSRMGSPRRLATISAGMSFGDAAVLSKATRSADVTADRAVHCLELSTARFFELGKTHPDIQSTILLNMLRDARHLVSRLSAEVAALRA